ncbi:hypothetical protein TDIS_1177 [Thermosulfurimonas dismutans]|uniref:PDZ domain-containing protein n=1 Tax=Thermosulfurimonas dismutans TaxID=999894 RepID=A0A179D4J4_9BACT|nr:hypothetical protein TDIS_1177 [Thermosulfurimonas dismutans]
MKRISFFGIIFAILFLNTSALKAAPKNNIPRVSVWININPQDHTITGKSVVLLPQGKVTWINVRNLILQKVLLGKKLIRPEIENGRFRVLSVGKNQFLEIHFRAYFPSKNFAHTKGFISKEEGLLLGNWFPAPEDLAIYSLRVSVPNKYKVITSAEELKVQKQKKVKIYNFSLFHPSPAPPLIFGKYEYYYRTWHNRTLALYLKVPDPELARNYLENALRALKTYEKLIGPYPYRRLSIVEISHEVGYSYPTLVLFGSKVIRLPFILKTSLSHEILHQWFGCSVYPDKGNWSEGLVTYLADYRASEEKGQGKDYRKDLLIAHETWCAGEDPLPLMNFDVRKDRCTQALGYGKGAFFFHMLKQQIGEQSFETSIKAIYLEYRYRKADWEDLRKIFEKYSRKDLSNFFRQWLTRKGKPKLGLTKRYLVKDEQGNYRLGLTIYQEAPYYDLELSLLINTNQERITKRILLKDFKKEIEITLNAKPQEVILDPDYDIWRTLSEAELPPNLGRVLSSPGKIWLEKEDWLIYRPIIHILKKSGYEVVFGPPPEPANERENLVYFGKLPGGIGFLFPDRKIKEGFLLEVKENPNFPQRVIMVAKAQDENEITAVISKLPHLWRYARLYFREGRTLEKDKEVGIEGLRLSLEAGITGLPLKKLLSLDEIIRQVSLSRVILVGEEHNRYEHHLAQLEIIKWLHNHGHKIAIGMEMFQQPFQKYLDLYLSGEISEQEFLKRTEYFKRWRFDWKLYKPILDYAKKNGIPVVALNIPYEITKKVARSGLESLSLEEKADLPEIDFSNEAYRAYLFEIYKKHREFAYEFPKFEFFYQAQLLWDEGMAEAASRWLSENPEYQMIILAGKGHIMYGYGIPSRIKRRGISSVATLVLGGNEKVTAGFADYILYPEPVAPPFTARLGVWLEEIEEGLRIAKVEKETPAYKVGLKKGDILVSADGQRLKSVADLKIILTFKKKGDNLELRYLREQKVHSLTIKF